MGVPLSDLRSAAYCPRQLYYKRSEADRAPPPEVPPIRDLAFRYGDLLRASDETLAELPIALDPQEYRRALERTRETIDRWDDLVHPTERDVLVDGKDCRGRVHKVLSDPVAPSIVSAGKPPEQGVWKPQSVHAVGAAKTLAWRHQTRVRSAYVEYPAWGVIRRIELSGRRNAAYRRTLRSVRDLEGPPPRVRDRSKCDPCAYSSQCGVKTRTLRSLLGRG